MYDFNGKNVVCVGGFTDVGYYMCRMMLQKKPKTMCILSRMENTDMMKKLQTEYPSSKVMYMQMNFMDMMMMEQTMKQMCSMLGNIDCLVNCMEMMNEKDLETSMCMNLTGMMQLTMLAMPYMDKSQMGQGGMVCNMSSVYGLEPCPCFPVYCAAKHGMIGFTRSMADKKMYQKTGVMFMCMCPGLTSNEMMMNLRENCMMKYCDEYMQAMETAKMQSPEECATQMMKCMEMMKNGSMWMINMGQMKEIMPTTYWQM